MTADQVSESVANGREAITVWRDERGRFYGRWQEVEFGPAHTVGRLLDSMQTALWFDHERSIGVLMWAEPRTIGSAKPT